MKCAICKVQPAVIGMVCSQQCEDQLEYNGALGFWEAGGV